MDFVCFFMSVSQFYFYRKGACSNGRADPRGAGKGRAESVYAEVLPAPEVRERKRQANIDFWARRYAEMTEMEKREAEKTR